jgi:thermitase
MMEMPEPVRTVLEDPMSRDHARLRLRLFAVALSVALLAGVVPAAVAAPPDHLRLPVRHAGTSESSELIVRFRDGTSSARKREIARGQGLQRLRETPGRSTVVYAAEGRSISALRSVLGAHPDVEAVAPNHRRFLSIDPVDEPFFGHLWGLHNTGQTVGPTGRKQTGVVDRDVDGLQALRVTLGSADVVVAVIDDGVDFSHPDLAGQAWVNPGETGLDEFGNDKATNGIDDDGNGFVDDVHGWDFCNNDNTVHDPGQDGHGTHVAGTIAANLDGQGVVGVAPGVRIMALKFIDDGTACGKDDMAIAAIEYAASFGIRIANASWGGENFSPVLDAAIGASGMLLVAAAGNGDRITGKGYDLAIRPFYPAASAQPNVLSVAAVDPAGTLATFSNYSSTKVHIAAPGVNVLSAYPGAVPGVCGPCWAWSDGTSMAAPHVSGIAALAASVEPSLLADPVALKERVLAKGKPLPDTTGKTATGRIADAWWALDWLGPLTAAPDSYRFVTGSILGSSGIKVKVVWPAAPDDMTGVASYLIQQKKGTGGWSTLASATTARSVTRTLAMATAYRFRVRARDVAGNTGPLVEGPTVTARLVQESNSKLRYTGTWYSSRSSAASGGRTRYATRAGASVSYTFTGRGIAVIAPKGPTRGSVKIYVDGSHVKTVSLYRAKTLSRMVIHRAYWAASGAHTVRLVVVGTKGRPRVDLDAFVVLR